MKWIQLKPDLAPDSRADSMQAANLITLVELFPKERRLSEHIALGMVSRSSAVSLILMRPRYGILVSHRTGEQRKRLTAS